MVNKFPNRKLTRHKDYDYSTTGYYFVTICINSRKEFFGKIVNSKMILNKFGNILKECWIVLPDHYPNCKLDYYLIIPNHFHGVVIIDNSESNKITKHYSLSEIIRGFKSFSSKQINLLLKEEIKFHWQKSFYDRVIRNEKELYQIKKYIEQNPLRWEIEKGIPENIFI